MMASYPELEVAVRVLIGLVFLVAAVSKMRHWSIFEGVIGNYRLLPQFAVRPFAWLMPPCEVAVGLAVLAGVPYASLAAAALLTLFALAMAVNILRGRSHIDCGCFNSALKQPLRWSLVLRNAVLTSLLGFSAGAPSPAPGGVLLLGALGGISLFVIVQCVNALLAIPALAPRHAHR
jgi:uncharacterized membrane protein YphA (DoxX/SURF4 family)